MRVSWRGLLGGYGKGGISFTVPQQLASSQASEHDRTVEDQNTSLHVRGQSYVSIPSCQPLPNHCRPQPTTTSHCRPLPITSSHCQLPPQPITSNDTLRHRSALSCELSGRRTAFREPLSLSRWEDDEDRFVSSSLTTGMMLYYTVLYCSTKPRRILCRVMGYQNARLRSIAVAKRCLVEAPNLSLFGSRTNIGCEMSEV
jgi:hypothetical protein